MTEIDIQEEELNQEELVQEKDVLFEYFTETATDLDTRLRSFSKKYHNRGEALINNTRKMRASLKEMDEMEEIEKENLDGLETEILGGEKIEEVLTELDTNPHSSTHGEQIPIA